MSSRQRLGAVLLALALLLAAFGPACLAEEYTYTVTLYSGNHALFTDGSSVMNLTGLKAGDMVNFADTLYNSVQLDDDTKYYLKGVRLSGRDNETVSSTAFRVTGDAMYVVAYGLRGEITNYTVNYLTEDGTPLAESQTFVGNVGDKPVVAFQYFEGYEPQAYNLTRTLSANAAENIFDFVYTAVGAAAGPGAAGEDEGDEETGQPGGEENPEGGNTNIDEENTPRTDPSQLIDLDPEKTPLAQGLEALFGDAIDISSPTTAGIIAGSALSLIILVVFLIRRKKEQKKTQTP